MRIVARNLTPTPLTVDRRGHQLGGAEFGVVDTDDRVTEAALAAGNLGEVERPPAGDDIDEAAAAAFADLDRRTADDEPAEQLSAGDPADSSGAAGDGSGSDEQLAAAAAAHAKPAKTAAPRKATS